MPFQIELRASSRLQDFRGRVSRAVLLPWLSAALLVSIGALGCSGGGAGGSASTGATGTTNTSVLPGTIVLFDFDTATSPPAVGSSLPFSQSKGGLSANFSDPTLANGYSIQNSASTLYTLSGFSGSYLVPNGLSPGPLSIQFSQAIKQASVVFATADFNQAEVPTTVMLTAYFGANSTIPVGSIQGHGTYATNTMPMGTLSFDSGGAPFDRVVISIPPQTLGTGDVLLDNISVTVH
jgi:hypothetical protein